MFVNSKSCVSCPTALRAPRIKSVALPNPLCTPLENLRGHIDESNKLIDCIVSTGTGKRLATIQASHQYKLYTGLEFPYV